jgi:hypothetical protein
MQNVLEADKANERDGVSRRVLGVTTAKQRREDMQAGKGPQRDDDTFLSKGLLKPPSSSKKLLA